MTDCWSSVMRRFGVPDRDWRLGTDLESLEIARSGGLEDRSRCLGLMWDLEIVGRICGFSWACRAATKFLLGFSTRSRASCFRRWARVSGSTLRTEIIAEDGARLIWCCPVNLGLLLYRVIPWSGRVDPALILPTSLTCQLEIKVFNNLNTKYYDYLI